MEIDELNKTLDEMRSELVRIRKHGPEMIDRHILALDQIRSENAAMSKELKQLKSARSGSRIWVQPAPYRVSDTHSSSCDCQACRIGY
jgi:hypothetical protein